MIGFCATYSHAQYPGEPPLVFDPGEVTTWPPDTQLRPGYYVVPVSPYWPGPCESTAQRPMADYISADEKRRAAQ